MGNLPKDKISKKLQSGQALLIVLLGMAVVLTMVLSVVSRSVTDIQLTTRDDEALRAFSAAEAGIEQALIIGTDIGEDNFEEEGGSTFSVNVEKLAEGETEYFYPEELYSGESGTVWFVSHDEDGYLDCTGDLPCFSSQSMYVCWANDDTATGVAPAIEVSVYYDADPGGETNSLGTSPDYDDVRVARYTFDPDPTRRGADDPPNHFSDVTSRNCDIAENPRLEFEALINFNFPNLPINCYSQDGCLLFAKVKMIYNSTTPHPLGFVSTGAAFPGQGVYIESTGQYADSTRQIDVFRTYREPLSIFESAIFSMGSNADLTK